MPDELLPHTSHRFRVRSYTPGLGWASFEGSAPSNWVSTAKAVPFACGAPRVSAPPSGCADGPDGPDGRGVLGCSVTLRWETESAQHKVLNGAKVDEFEVRGYISTGLK